MMSEFSPSVRAAIDRLSPEDTAVFYVEYSLKRKSAGTAYILSLLFLHYAYVGRVGMTVIGWLLSFATGGVTGVIWWIIDLFRIPGIVANFNSTLAMSILRDQKIIGLIK